VTLTAEAFKQLFPYGSGIMLAVVVSLLSMSTVLTFWYYGSKCLGFLIGAEYQHRYIWIYVVLVVLGSVASLNMVISLVDSMYALMAIPTMTAALLLAPRVNRAASVYFKSSGTH
jgi:AGCS family alanine or glycine:cation symporter